MREAKAVSEALGIHIDERMIERRLDAAGKATGHKMSMLQDLERGRSMEIDALVTAVQELGRLTGVADPDRRSAACAGAGARRAGRPLQAPRVIHGAAAAPSLR